MPLRWVQLVGSDERWAHWNLEDGKGRPRAVVFRLPNVDPEPWIGVVNGTQIQEVNIETLKVLVELLL